MARLGGAQGSDFGEMIGASGVDLCSEAGADLAGDGKGLAGLGVGVFAEVPAPERQRQTLSLRGQQNSTPDFEPAMPHLREALRSQRRPPQPPFAPCPGWCGGAIYFVATPVLPRTKYGPDTHAGAVIQATMDMGRMATMDRRCRSSFGTGIRAARRGGYDSLRFDPGDGAEYVIASASRVLSMRRYK